MSFNSLNLRQLEAAAKEFQVEVREKATKKEIITAIREKGISWQTYKKFFDHDEDSVEEVETEEPSAAEQFDNTVLLKMDRQNPRFDIFGYTFTREHPFKVMSENDAQQIIDNAEGFRIASPKEAKEYYS